MSNSYRVGIVVWFAVWFAGIVTIFGVDYLLRKDQAEGSKPRTLYIECIKENNATSSKP